MKVLLATLGLLFITTNAAASKSWVKITETKEVTFSARVGSFEQSITERSREPIAIFLVQIKNKKAGTTNFEKNYVKLSDCRAGYGKLVTTDLNGKAEYSSDFVFQGGNVASILAEGLCTIAFYKELEEYANSQSKGD